MPGKYEFDATRIGQHTASQRSPDTAAQQHCHFSGHLNLVFHTSFRIFIHILLCITVMSSSFDVMSSSFDVMSSYFDVMLSSIDVVTHSGSLGKFG